jgi:hypothetical protein
MKLKIIDFKFDRGLKAKVQSHNYRNGKWIVNDKFEMFKLMYALSPRKFLYFKEYNKEVNNGL